MLKAHSDRVAMLKDQPILPFGLDGRYDRGVFDCVRQMHRHFSQEKDYGGIIPV